MLIGIKIFVTSICIYAGVRLAGIAMSWMKHGFDKLKPRRED